MNVSNTYKNNIKKRKYCEYYFQFGFAFIENKECLRNACK